MAQYSQRLDDLFQALADPTRRAVLRRLGGGPASVSELARPFPIALPSFMKHIHLLESSGWIRTRKKGRVRTCTLRKQRLADAEGWLSAQRKLWEDRTDRLQRFATTHKGGPSVTAPAPNPELDLTISRVIKAPRPAVWSAWTDRASFEQWWVPAPAACRVVEMDLRPGGSFVTEISEDGGDFGPHITGCFLAVDHLERIVFTNALVGGWRPAEHPLMTAIITMRDHALGTEYVAHVLHRNRADREKHEAMGFYDGWGTVTEQLARVAERRASRQRLTEVDAR
jgi:uncharacterized protein YndB with AHSA1/START domain/DNA-binding transcriptional ArsR family regulator